MNFSLCGVKQIRQTENIKLQQLITRLNQFVRVLWSNFIVGAKSEDYKPTQHKIFCFSACFIYDYIYGEIPTKGEKTLNSFCNKLSTFVLTETNCMWSR